jgi:hypothetical protein
MIHNVDPNDTNITGINPPLFDNFPKNSTPICNDMNGVSSKRKKLFPNDLTTTVTNHTQVTKSASSLKYSSIKEQDQNNDVVGGVFLVPQVPPVRQQTTTITKSSSSQKRQNLIQATSLTALQQKAISLNQQQQYSDQTDYCNVQSRSIKQHQFSNYYYNQKKQLNYENLEDQRGIDCLKSSSANKQLMNSSLDISKILSCENAALADEYLPVIKTDIPKDVQNELKRQFKKENTTDKKKCIIS